ncbi:hypothetical protein XF_0018 [Xylella fastidiosa 9a5c]|uniref:Uncharacterized protein n=1 Tax=Xylella fastidiosa (strain 9a5c) TaxID=160492 RepID=Q9PHC6_XYLFA|nr:hypothetical protein XF_0018 [Xylella fastidiosa 9a5c]
MQQRRRYTGIYPKHLNGRHNIISNQQSAISNQQSAISNQQSAISNQQSAISNMYPGFFITCICADKMMTT